MRTFIGIALVAGALLGGVLWYTKGMGKPAISPSQYNLIMVSIDTLRADHLGSYGYSRDTAPNLDKFAQESVVFEQAFAQAPFTTPSEASVFTSQYPAVHGVTGIKFKLDSEKVMLAEILKENNYQTAAFTGGPGMSSLFGFPQGFDTYVDFQSGAGLSFQTSIPRAIEWLVAHRQNRFFLFLHGYDVHGPYHDPFEHRFDPDYSGILADHEKFIFDYSEVRTPGSIMQHIKKIDGKLFLVSRDQKIPLEKRDMEHVVAHYDGGIFYTDSLLQEFFDEVKRMGLYENSIIIVYSDHGESLDDSLPREPVEKEQRIIKHRELFEEVTRVPLMIKYPGVQPKRITQQVELVDLFPTVVDLLKVPVSSDVRGRVQGKSLTPLLEDKPTKVLHEYVYGQGDERHLVYIRSKQWKLIQGARGEFMLYDLEADPGETQNVLGRHPEVAEQLQTKLLQWTFENLEKKTQLYSNEEHPSEIP